MTLGMNLVDKVLCLSGTLVLFVCFDYCRKRFLNTNAWIESMSLDCRRSMSVFHCDITIFRFIYLFLNLSIHISFQFLCIHLLMPFNFFDSFLLFYCIFSLRIEKILRDKIMSWRPRFVTRWNR